ncbi:type II toxin-antitoxin system VapC family toxin [Larkinella terrae]|uniref:Ribonuclease VapC n=1 Tax=Larkinella terrae TaxID=2025311 RepID=A0A7K0EN21_9BACT|nr:type II toxin-antitoxin system VapC family toxin [Larkinella terrae]MRS63217.1 PIN domain-containing protein [Larkinella terrae]
MAEKICVDTNLLINHRRTLQKGSSELFDLTIKYEIVTTSISVFELWRGDQTDESFFWEKLFQILPVLPFDTECAKIAGQDFLLLRKQGLTIGVEDVLIAAVAKCHGLRLATLNTKHFSRIPDLKLVDL